MQVDEKKRKVAKKKTKLVFRATNFFSVVTKFARCQNCAKMSVTTNIGLKCATVKVVLWQPA